MSVEEIRNELMTLQDPQYREFMLKLLPTVAPEQVLGIRTPELRKMAKQLMAQGETEAFLHALPHQYFEENQLHAFIVSGIKDYGQCISEVSRFLPYVDNWATCDQMSPPVFRRHRTELLSSIREWLETQETYTIRFAIGMLMAHYLDEAFDPAYPEMVASVRSEEYYVRMMIAWYFATALAKQYKAVLPYIEEHRLDSWTHDKTIQKAVESYRIGPEEKAYLKTLKGARKK